MNSPAQSGTARATDTPIGSAACIIAGARTPIGRRSGAFVELHAKDLGALAIREAIRRAGVESAEVDDVTLGSTLAPEGNLARVAWLQSGGAVSVPARSIDRQCGSGIDAVWLAAQAIGTGSAKLILAGGAESMTHEPFQLERTVKGAPMTPPKFLRRELSTDEIGDPIMGITAENLARQYGISREAQDTYAVESQRNMAQAQANGYLADALVKVDTKGGVVDVDEHPRPQTSREGLAKLRPVFEQDGTVTAGNASGINDGAAAVLVTSEAHAAELGAAPLARIVDGAVVGVDPNTMGIGPAPAIERLLSRTGWALDDVDVIEINEAFAVQVLAVLHDLGLDRDRVNRWGGAIAHGHPIAATGTMLVMKAIDQLSRRGGGKAIVSACIGGGQGIALALQMDQRDPGPTNWNPAGAR